MSIFIISHLRSYSKTEFAIFESPDNLANIPLNISEVVFDIWTLWLGCHILRFQVVKSFLHLRLSFVFILGRFLGKVFKVWNILIKILVLVFHLVTFLIQNVDIIIQRIVLFLSLDVSRHNLINRCYPCSFPNLVECILYYSWVPQVLI